MKISYQNKDPNSPTFTYSEEPNLNMTWQDFFKEHGDNSLQYLAHFEKGPDSVKVEELYQAFEARLFEKFSSNLIRIEEGVIKFLGDGSSYFQPFDCICKGNIRKNYY